MASFQLPKVTVLDTSGDPVSGALLHFYLTGTTTETNTYTDVALTTPHANPVVCDSAGRAGAIYLDSAITYKCVVADSGDTPIYTVDPVPSDGGSTVTARVSQIASSPLDYGAVGDGVADETSFVQDAIDAATGTVDLTGKTFRCDTSLTLKSGLRLVNGTLDFTQNTTETALITATGSIGAGNVLTANAEVGDLLLSVTSAGTIAPYSWIRVTSATEQFSGASDAYVSEWLVVNSVSALDLTIGSPLLYDYLTATNSEVNEFTFVEDVVLRDLTILAAPQGGVEQDGIYLKYCKDFKFENCRFDNVDESCVRIDSSINFKINDCTFIGIDVTNGIEVHEGCGFVSVNGCHFEGMSTAIVVGASDVGDTENRGCQSTQVDGCNVHGDGLGVVIGDSSIMTTITNNRLVGTGYGISSLSGSLVVTGNTMHRFLTGIFITPVKNVLHDYGTLYNTDRRSHINVSNNIIEFCGLNGIQIQTVTVSTYDIEGIRISDNTINGCGFYGVSLAAVNNSMKNVVITGNNVNASEYSNIHVVNTSAFTIEGLSISNNHLDGVGGLASIHVSSDLASEISRVNITGNTIDTSFYGIEVTNATVVNITGNHIYGSNYDSIRYESDSGAGADCTDINISNNICKADVGDCLYVYVTAQTINRLIISGNTVHATDGEGIFVETTLGENIKGVVISENTIECTETDKHGIRVEAASNEEITNVSIVGNSIRSLSAGGPDYGIYCIYVYHLTVSGNTIIADGGMNIKNCDQISVSGNTIATQAKDGIYINNTTGNTTEGVNVSGNLITGTSTTDYGIQVASGDYNEITDVSINGNTIQSNTADALDYGIYMWGVQHLSVSNNVIRCDGGIDIEDSDGISVNGNTINALVSSATAAIYVHNGSTHGSDGVNISKNLITGGADTKYGIYCTCATNNDNKEVCIDGNVIRTEIGSAFEYAVYCDSLQHLSVSNNTIRSDGGIYILDCDFASARGNSIRYTANNGILFKNAVSVDNCNISNNSIHALGVGGGGIKIWNSGTNTLLRGLVVSCNSLTDTASNTSPLLFVLFDGTTVPVISTAIISGNCLRMLSATVNIGALTIDTNGSSGLFRDSSISGNMIYRDVNSNNASCIRLNETTNTLSLRDFFIVGNSLFYGGEGIYSAATTITRVMAAGNYISDSADYIDIAGGAFTYAAESVTAGDLPNLEMT